MDRQLLLLGLLRQQEMHGYQLHELINWELISCADLKKPTTYFLLNKIVESGWISETESQEGNCPLRRVCIASQKRGEAEFQRLLRENLAAYHAVHFAGDIGLAFMDTLGPFEALALLVRRRALLAEELADMRIVPRHHGSLQLVVDHRVRYLTAELSWLDDLVTRLRSQGAQIAQVVE